MGKAEDSEAEANDPGGGEEADRGGAERTMVEGEAGGVKGITRLRSDYGMLVYTPLYFTSLNVCPPRTSS